MPAVHLHDVSFHYTSAVPVLSDVALSLGTGWIGVVGANGAGKTTLLRLIDGSLAPSAGSVVLDPGDGVVVHCPQTADTIDPNIAALAEARDGAAHSLLGRLELDRRDLERWRTLSPGERKRWQIGGALYRDPDVLLLDEPTNHLDTDARHLLLEALRRYRGVGLVVSHDRTVLDLLCRKILRIERGSADLWNGSYDVARSGWETQDDQLARAYEEVTTERKQVERRLADKRRVSATREARHRRQLRTAGIKDKDARSMEKKGRFAGGQSKGSHDINLLRAEAERLQEQAAGYGMYRRLGGEMSFAYEAPRRNRLLSYAGPLVAGEQVLMAAVDVSVERGDRILLEGPNGAGKSTLLRALLSNSSLPEERVLYLPQELTETETRALLAHVARLDAGTRGRVLGIVGVLGSDPKRVLATDMPSPGEARKLLIATGLGTGAWLLLLDEPTNHLDLPSIERLERALEAYPGAVVVVTHDDQFGRGTTETTWTIEDGELKVD
jgi:ATPase subunit of ABC transporter with duplicated ATPase domains